MRTQRITVLALSLSAVFFTSSAALARGGVATAVVPASFGGDLRLKLSFWGGPELRRDGTLLKLGTFGGGYEDIFRGSDRALDAMRTYRALRMTGTACRLLAVGALVTNIVLGAIGTWEFGSAGSLSLFFSSLGLSLGGSAFMQGADVYLSRAVDHYNSDLSATRVGFSYGGRF